MGTQTYALPYSVASERTPFNGKGPVTHASKFLYRMRFPYKAPPGFDALVEKS